MLNALSRLVAAVLLLVCSGALAGPVKVVVKVPADTPASDSVFLAGSLPGVGGWKADGLRLYRSPGDPATTFTGEFEAEPGQTLEFKITRGTWATVEKNADGTDRPNRTVTIAPSTTVEATVLRWGEGSASPSSVVGRLSMDLLLSERLGGSRMLRVWLPPSYYSDPAATFPVLYMHDAQNCFDAATSTIGREWRVDETLTELVKKGAVPPMVVVAIDHAGADRTKDYTYPSASNPGGRADRYEAFLFEEVMPFVARNYRVKPGREHTFIGGSSLGGLVSLEIARRRPGAFGGVMAMSPALWWGEEALTRALGQDAGGLAGARVWVDMGTKESVGSAGPSDRLVAMTRRLAEVLTKAGVENRLEIAENAEHNESAWAARLPEAVVYLTSGR